MPDNIDNTVNSFMTQVKKIEDSLRNDLEKLAYKMNDMTDTELLLTTKRLNFLQELVDKGYGKQVNNLMSEYDTLLSEAAKEAKIRGIVPMRTETVEAIQTLKDLDTEKLLGRAKAWGDEMKSLMFTNIYGGASIRDTITAMGEINLASHQLNVAVNTGLRQFSDFSRYNVFKGEDVKWIYVGPDDGVTRPKCQNTLLNSKNNLNKGFSESEVGDSGTPFGVRGGYNCSHSWMVA